MAASACRSPADKGAPTGPEGYRGIKEVGVGADAVRREPAPEAGARSGVERNGVHAVRALTDRVVSGRRELAARLIRSGARWWCLGAGTIELYICGLWVERWSCVIGMTSIKRRSSCVASKHNRPKTIRYGHVGLIWQTNGRRWRKRQSQPQGNVSFGRHVRRPKLRVPLDNLGLGPAYRSGSSGALFVSQH